MQRPEDLDFDYNVYESGSGKAAFDRAYGDDPVLKINAFITDRKDITRLIVFLMDGLPWWDEKTKAKG